MRGAGVLAELAAFHAKVYGYGSVNCRRRVEFIDCRVAARPWSPTDQTRAGNEARDERCDVWQWLCFGVQWYYACELLSSWQQPYDDLSMSNPDA